MKKLPSIIYLRIAKVLLSLLISREILYLPEVNLYVKLFSIFVALLLPLNDYARGKIIKKGKSPCYFVSLIASIIVTNLLFYEVGSIETYTYYFFPLQEILVDFDNIPFYLLIPHFIVYMLTNYLKGNLTTPLSLLIILYPYFSAIPIIYLFRNTNIEKQKVLTLNEELKNSNATLKKYSEKIEELTISKERARIAQELHDSLGHSLMALNMNLEYAESVVVLKPEKAGNAIKKAHSISKDCITDLRKAVSVLKENFKINELRKSLDEIFENFQGTDKLHFDLDMKDNVEASNPDIKNCIYKTVQEAITNGVKHGKATNFSIKIFKETDMILLIIKDNGSGCDEIRKSNGIKGIENRITALGGIVRFVSSKGCGFSIEVNIHELE